MIAVASIGLMTIPANFDTTSTLFLASMHLTSIPVTLTCLRGLHSSSHPRTKAMSHRNDT